jgi:hypothetical protein
MNLGLRGLLVLVAVVLFVISALFADVHQGDLIAWGLAAFAASFVVESIPMSGPSRPA